MLLHVHEHGPGLAILCDDQRLTPVGDLLDELLCAVLEVGDRSDVRGFHRPEYSIEF